MRESEAEPIAAGDWLVASEQMQSEAERSEASDATRTMRPHERGEARSADAF